MRVAILTTETPHHSFYVRSIKQICCDVVVFSETAGSPKHSFATYHPFEDDREDYEWNRWFQGRKTGLATLAPTRAVPSMNAPSAIAALRADKPDLVVVFGTGVLRPPVIDAADTHIFNLHGGDPEEYRGLDTHLWAVYHRDFKGLITTLHRLDAGLDTGDIVLQAPVRLQRDMKLQALRAANTELCVTLTAALIGMTDGRQEIPMRSQRRQGRYYSAMPADLKSVCQTHFEKHTAGLSS
jgi:methionyl-tRNA formyltransferase